MCPGRWRVPTKFYGLESEILLFQHLNASKRSLYERKSPRTISRAIYASFPAVRLFFSQIRPRFPKQRRVVVLYDVDYFYKRAVHTGQKWLLQSRRYSVHRLTNCRYCCTILVQGCRTSRLFWLGRLDLLACLGTKHFRAL